jgi:hypothetical protein
MTTLSGLPALSKSSTALPVFLVQRLSRQGESARNGLAATNANLRTSSPTAPLI